MASTHKARVPMAEQIRLINECRQSGMIDADWCRKNDIAVNTFYNWVSRCRRSATDQIPAPNYGHFEISRSEQDVNWKIYKSALPHTPLKYSIFQMQLSTKKSFAISL